MANLKLIGMRLKAITNIQKITKSMKMVSAAKYARAERDLKSARPFGDGAKQFYTIGAFEDDVDMPKGANVIIAVSSDRGMCGAIHNSIARRCRVILQEESDIQLVVIGEKAKSIVQYNYSKNISASVSDVGRKPPVFLDAAKIYIGIRALNFITGRILYNKFISIVSYKTTETPIYSLQALYPCQKLTLYDSVDHDVLESYLEFSVTTLLFYAMIEGSCSELSARVSAMDNATKNAGEMINQLQLTFNRTRQALITRELIEIISGAAALKKDD